jgi:hypothetical protein
VGAGNGSFAEPPGDAFKPDSRLIEGRLGRGIGDEPAPAGPTFCAERSQVKAKLGKYSSR